MKQISTLKKGQHALLCPIFLLLPLALLITCSLQSQNKIRTYANYQATYVTALSVLGSPTLSGSVTSDLDAADLSPFSSSLLSVGLGVLNTASATQYLEFTTNGTHASKRLIPAGTPVTIKLSLPKEILGVLSSISVGSFSDLTVKGAHWPIAGQGNFAGYSSPSQVEYCSGATLLNLLTGAGDAEITITPSGSFNGIYIKLSSLISVGLSAKLYHAYILENGTWSTDFNKRIDAVAGVRDGTIVGGVASATGSVINPQNVIDADAYGTYSLMSTGALVTGEVYHRAVFERPSIPGDSLRVVIQDPGAGLIDLNVLSGFSIQPYLNNVKAGTSFSNGSALLKLRLLGGAGNKYELVAPVYQSYDRVEIKMGGVANALTNLRIYDVSRVASLSVLPVSLTGFYAATKNDKIELIWNTENESNIASYTVQKSTDGNSFKTAGIVFPFENSTSNSYSFKDGSPSTGINYYRLSINDKDGSSKFSRLVTANFGTYVSQLQIAPNPAKDVIRLRISGMERGSYRIELRNVSGKLMVSRTIQVVQGDQTEVINRDRNIQPGIYWLGVFDKNNQHISTLKIFAE